VKSLKPNRLNEIDINIEQTALCYNGMLEACFRRAEVDKIKKAA
jgi:hypothetical protein